MDCSCSNTFTISMWNILISVYNYTYFVHVLLHNYIDVSIVIMFYIITFIECIMDRLFGVETLSFFLEFIQFIFL